MNIRVCFLISNEYIVIVYQFGKHLIGKENYDEKWNKRSNLIKKKYMNKMSKYLRLTWKKTHPFIHFFLFMTFFFHFTRPHLIFFFNIFYFEMGRRWWRALKERGNGGRDIGWASCHNSKTCWPWLGSALNIVGVLFLWEFVFINLLND